MMFRYTAIVKKSFLWLLSFLLLSCVEPVDLELPADVGHLVVQGLITDEPGPYTVKLMMTYPYGRPTGIKDVELQGAQVVISSGRGEKELLREEALGVFRTSKSGIRGKAGETYTLSVRLTDGRTYTSRAELLAPTPAIEEIQLNFQKEPVYEGVGEPIANLRYEAAIHVTDPAKDKNFYRWEWRGVYEVATQPWDYEYWPPLGNGPVPMPKPCCVSCWVYDSTNVTEVGEDRLFNGNRFRKIVGYLPLNAETINIRYRMEVIQYSLSPEAYDFWRVFVNQTRNTGSVLDSPPANPKGNITSTTNPEEPVYGYFGASAVTRKAVFINREDVPEVPPLLQYPDDCRVMKLSTAIRPSFW